MLNEGVDVPDASVGVILSGSASAREFIQRLGRILRRGVAAKQAVLYEVIAKETREERVADRRRAPPEINRKAERIEATLALFDSANPSAASERGRESQDRDDEGT
ncbi:MAG: hypothetical protein IPK63_06065 [Candidatus Competibacteraceae bacterium]|nr:hypothetical protein [Candidatus Competibacteraceae bacterium]